MIKRVLFVFIALLLFLLSACVNKPEPYVPSFADDSSEITDKNDDSSSGVGDTTLSAGEMRVHFIDVGQGDSIFVELPNKKCMLIDASERDYAGRIISFVECLGYKKIDYLVATHPHSDHIGGMQRVVENFDVGEVFMPDAVSDTATFLDLLETLETRNLSITVAEAGKRLFSDGAVSADCVAPARIVDDLNNCSIVIKLKYDEKSFLFMGDAEVMEEETIVSDIKCDVLKVGHHGSRTSSGNSFLTKCKPSIAIISCGKDNEYGHPHTEALDRLDKNGIKNIYRTDISGTVTIDTNGKTLSVSEGYNTDSYKWVLNISSKKLHTSECDSAVDMKVVNRAYSIRSLDELKNLGYTLCGTCKPKE